MGAGVPYARVRRSRAALARAALGRAALARRLTVMHEERLQKSPLTHLGGALRSPVDPPPLSLLEETEGLSDDLPAAPQLRAEPRPGSLAVWSGVLATAPVPDAPEPPGTWRQSPPHY